MQFDRNKLKEKSTTITVKTGKTLQELDLTFFFNYRIFPAAILVFKTQWEAEHRSMKVGDTIEQQVFLPPVPFFSQKLVFWVRINEIVQETHHKSFSYETLEGHVEQGISRFSIEETDGVITITIHTFSEPGNLITRILGPIITLPYQAYCTRQALKNIKKQLEQPLNL